MTPEDEPNVLLIPNIVSEEERKKLENIAVNCFESGVLGANPVGPNRYFCKIYGTKYCTPFIKSIGERIISRLGLTDFPVDEYLGWIVSLIMPDGFVQLHDDKFDHYLITSNRHLRCNILVTDDDLSFLPIVAKNEIVIPKSSMWSFYASELQHGTQVIQGTKPRIVFQFGFSVPESYVLTDRLGVA